MAQRAFRALRRPGLSYRRIVVPLVAAEESEAAMALAAELADEHGTSIFAVVAIELPPQLPIGAHMLEEEAEADLIVLHARRTPRLGRTVRHVLHHAPCRVLLAAPSP